MKYITKKGTIGWSLLPGETLEDALPYNLPANTVVDEATKDFVFAGLRSYWSICWEEKHYYVFKKYLRELSPLEQLALQVE